MPNQAPKLEDHPLSSAAAYSMYSQLPAIAGGCTSICNLRTCSTVMKTWASYTEHRYIFVYNFRIHNDEKGKTGT
jgi:hypothetical protein